MDLSPIRPKVLEKIDITESCWIWQGAKDKYGYGVINKEYYGEYFVHRYTYRHLVGDPGPVLDHLCRVTLCVNPFHLEPVNQAENMARGNVRSAMTNKWAKPRNCPQGHPLSGDNLYQHFSVKLNRLNRQCRTCKRDGTRRRYHQSRSVSY